MIFRNAVLYIVSTASLTLNQMNYICLLMVEIIPDLNVERILYVVVLLHFFLQGKCHFLFIYLVYVYQ